MKKEKVFGILGVAVLFVLLALMPETANAQTSGKQQIFSIEEPVWISNSGMSKGKDHDRQDLGFVLKANATLRVKTSDGKKLIMRLLGNDSKKEKQVTLGADWVEISGEEDMVPFVDTPFDTSETTIEYVVDGAQSLLPIYSSDGSEKSFFNDWDTSDAQYALIKGKDFQLLIPNEDKEKVRNLADFDSIDELLGYYDELFDMFNQIAGFDGSSTVNKNGANRYFLKADRNGAGGAYYGRYWSANSISSVDMWLRKRSWGTLHEIAHGYQTGFDGQGMFTGEVSNNLFGVQYEYSKYGNSVDQTGWLFDYGKKDSVEQILYDKLIENNETYDSVDLREKLILMTMLKQKAGDEAFTKMYQGYRELANQSGFDKSDYKLPDLLNRYYSEHSQLDFTPVLTRWGLTLSGRQSVLNQTKGYPAVASLADVVPEGQLVNARALIDPSVLITSNFEMVKNSEIAPLGLKGELCIQLETKAITKLIGAKIQIKEGAKVVQEKRITGTTVTFTDLPNGVYSIVFSGGNMLNYVPSVDYVYVKEAKNEVSIPVKELSISQVTNQKIVFTGLGDSVFGDFTVDLNNEEAMLTLTEKDPHVYFNGRTYASVKISDATGKVKYDRTIEGANVQVGKEQMELHIGDQIEIYHAETISRLLSSDNIVLTSQNTNKWIVTKLGLQNQQLGNDPEADLIKKIDQRATSLLQENLLKDIPLAQLNEKKQLYAAIQSLSETNKNQLMEKYAALFALPKVEDGSDFQYTLKGLGDWVFSTLDISLDMKQAVITTKAGQPHVYFSDTYGMIRIQNSEGESKYEKNYVGTQIYGEQKETVALSIGDYITVMHKEHSGRLTIQNQDQNVLLENAETITYQVTDKGLSRKDTASIPKPQIEKGSEFQFTFKGLGDNVFSVMDISIVGGYMMVTTKAGKPHVYFNEVYGAIEVQNSHKITKYKQTYVGSQMYQDDVAGLDLGVGDYIILTHKEHTRLVIQNKDQNEQLKSAETITYQVTKDGLRLVSN